ncbi:MAG: hypothetical protein U1E17_21915 [Geminicoccaceae bacterium]
MPLPGLLLLAGVSAAAQPGPQPLFPPAPPPQPAPAPSIPLAVPPPTIAPPPITLVPLPPAPEAAPGLAAAAAELRGPLWSAGAPPDLAALLARLPGEITEPSLRQLQLALLLAPGPSGPDEAALLAVRLDRLLAMAAPEAALDLLAALPPERLTPELRARQVLAGLAADRSQAACATAAAEPATAAPWPQARLVCAALAGDPRGVELGLDLLTARGQVPAPALAELAEAVAGGRRLALSTPLSDDPLLLPLLRRAELDLRPGMAAALPLPARRALLANTQVAAAVRAAAAGERPGPSARPELNGTAAADWAASFAAVPPAQQARWAALVDGQGLELPEAIWVRLAADAAAAAPAPPLALWRGFEVARARGQRGAMLLYLLLLLDGRPEQAAPVTLRRALDALGDLDLAPAARALAAGTGGAIGL